MAELFGKNYTNEEIRRLVGTMRQLAGTRTFEYVEGKAAGVKAIEVYTGSGLCFTVLPGRGMDIADASYCGKPLAWLCKNGIVGPQYFENGWNGFFRSFSGGLLATCGLTNTGPFAMDGDEVLGVHGRISNTPAETFHTEEYWDGDEYYIKVKGSVRESSLYAENMVLNREITVKLGGLEIKVTDSFENQGFCESPFMMFYHMNFGYPVLSPNTKLYIPSEKVIPLNESAKSGDGLYGSFSKPVKDYKFQCFKHIMPGGRDKIYAALINEEMNFGVYISYPADKLPSFDQWKLTGEQEYVVALEPGISGSEGRISARDSGSLRMLGVGEKFEVSYEIGVIKDKKDIDRIKRLIEG